MIITEQKLLAEIIDSLKNCTKVFLVGCGECATTCKTGGKDQLDQIKVELEKAGKQVTGMAIPSAPCVVSQTKTEFAKNMPSLRQSEAILVFACGLGTQSVKESDRLNLAILPGCNSLFGASMDTQGDFVERCSLCGECILADTGGICPVTLCAKGLLNGPCGGANKGKCEVDIDKDCAWVLIYKELEKKKQLENFKTIRPPKDYKKTIKPHKVVMAK